MSYVTHRLGQMPGSTLERSGQNTHFYEAVLVPNLSENFLLLSRSNEKLSRSNEKLSRSNEKLSRSNEKLSRYNEKVSRSNEKLSRSNEKLSRSNEKIISFWRENYLVLTRYYLVLTRNYLVWTRYYLVRSRNCLVRTRKLSCSNEILSRSNEKKSRSNEKKNHPVGQPVGLDGFVNLLIRVWNTRQASQRGLSPFFKGELQCYTHPLLCINMYECMLVGVWYGLDFHKFSIVSGISLNIFIHLKS